MKNEVLEGYIKKNAVQLNIEALAKDFGWLYDKEGKTFLEKDKNYIQRKFFEIKIRVLKENFEICLDLLKKIIEMYKELYHETQFYEKKNTIDFDYDEWYTVKKCSGWLTRKYNELLKIYKKL